jgi:hypothetical protein
MHALSLKVVCTSDCAARFLLMFAGFTYWSLGGQCCKIRPMKTVRVAENFVPRRTIASLRARIPKLYCLGLAATSSCILLTCRADSGLGSCL